MRSSEDPNVTPARPPERLQRALRDCASGEVPPNVALLKLLIDALDPHEAEEALREAHRVAGEQDERGRLARALALLADNPQAFGTVKAVLRGVEHGGTALDADRGLTDWAAAFDRMAATSPEGSVALYALGNPDLLKAATAEIVSRLEDWQLLGPARTGLDFGCGTGRLTEALSRRMGRITGIDISPGMVGQARTRCAALPNVTLRVSPGRDLSEFPAASFDLIVAADVFPYLVQIGADLVAAHIREAARVLRTGGSLVILNLSYRNDPARDLRDVETFGRDAGMVLARHSTGDFTLWDGVTFHLMKPVAGGPQPR
jgi:SAM-dependent methyltransferase